VPIFALASPKKESADQVGRDGASTIARTEPHVAIIFFGSGNLLLRFRGRVASHRATDVEQPWGKDCSNGLDSTSKPAVV
jgi:hypothetical protein